MTQLRGDPHARFRAWLLDGADAPLPRDVALHASLCMVCRADTAAFDLLTVVDLSRAGPPPIGPAVRAPTDTWRRAVVATGGALATTAAVAAVAVALQPRTTPLPVAAASPASVAPTQAVLGNTGRPAAKPSASPMTSTIPMSTPVAVLPTAAPITPPLAPTIVPHTPSPGLPTPRPTILPTATPPPATATPSATPPPETPTPEPTATPAEPTPTETAVATP